MYCISCGCLWGDGENIGSSGVCPQCFTGWINNKKKLKGLRMCYGEFKRYIDVDCDNCTVISLCFRDTYEIK